MFRSMEEFRACECLNKERRRFICSNGSAQIRLQCISCGKTSQPVKREENDDKLSEVDYDMWRNMYDLLQKQETALNIEKHEQEQAHQKEERQKEYSEYLQSSRWHEIRAKVLERDNHLCQGCLMKRASQVHHMTYENIYNELCFQLVSLCRECHEKTHEATK